MLGLVKSFRVLAALCCGSLFALAAWAAPAKTDKEPAASAIYHNYCSVCHGDKGDAQSRARGSFNPPPRDFTTARSLSELTRDRMIVAVKAGVPGTAMAGWQTQLSQKQIESVVDYVRETFMRASSNADASRGRQIYAKSCSVCHGDRGDSSVWASANLRPAPRDFSAPQARVELTRERMLTSVAGGRPGTAMAGFASQLKAAEIEAVVDYIRTSFMLMDAEKGISGTRAHAESAAQAALPPTPAAKSIKSDMSLPMPSGLKGDAAAGRRFYDANCATCHGVKGDGQGPRAYFINPKPRVLISEETRALYNRPAIFAGVSAGRLGSEMPAWDKVLTPQEIANVSEYVFQAFIRPGSEKATARRNP